MKKTKHIAVLFLILSVALSHAQDQPSRKIEDVNQIWAGYFSSIKLSSKFAINSDIQGRTTDWYKQWSQAIVRTGFAYKPNEKFTFTVGFADFLFFQKNNTVSRNEYRPWEELAISDNYKNIKISHRFRFEQRYFQQAQNGELIDSYKFNHRFRYRIDLQIPLWKAEERSLNFLFGNEVMLNAGKSITYNYFDQNRTWVGLGYTLNKKITLQAQFIYIFQQLSNGYTLDRISVARFTIYHTINLQHDTDQGK